MVCNHKNGHNKTVSTDADTDIVITIFILKKKLWLTHTTMVAIIVATHVLTEVVKAFMWPRP